MPEWLFLAGWVLMLVGALAWHHADKRRRRRAFERTVAEITRNGDGRKRL